MTVAFESLSGVQDRFLKFHNLTIEDGLSNQFVSSIAQDGNGLCWFASSRGLDSYDGKTVRSYRHHPGDPTSLPDNRVSKIFADCNGCLWIATDSGLCRMTVPEKFDPVLYNCETLSVQGFANCLGGVLLLSDGSLLRYDFESESIARILPRLEGTVLAICQEPDGGIMINDSRQGILRLDFDSSDLELMIPCDAEDFSGEFIKDSHNNIWAASNTGGLLCYSLNDGEYSLRKSYTTENSGLSNNLVFSLLENDGEIWIATDGGGINVLDPETDDFTVYTYNPDNYYGIQSKSICMLYKSPDGTIWASTVRDGVIGIRRQPVRTIRAASPDSHYGLSVSTVLSMLKDDSGIVWIGTDGGGLNSYDPDTKLCDLWPSTSDLKITSITTCGPGKLLLGCYFDRLKVFDKGTGRISDFHLADPEIERLFFDTYVITTVCQVSEDKLYLFIGDDFYSCSLKDRNCSFISNLGPGTVVRIISTSARYTVAVKNGSVFEIDNESDSIKILYSQDEIVSSADVDKSGRIWLADTKTLKSSLRGNIDVREERLPIEMSPSMVRVEDSGKLWVCDRNNIVMYDSSIGKYRVFGAADGVTSNFYEERPSVFTDKSIIFGSDNGLVEIDRKAVDRAAPEPISGVSFRTASANGHELYVTNGALSLPNNFRQLTMWFNIVKSNIFDNREVTFHLDDGHKVIDIISECGIISVSSLPAGQYSVTATCLSSSGERHQLSLSPLTINVNRPVMASWPMVMVYILLLALLVCGIVKYQNHRRSLAYARMIDENQKKQEQGKINFLVNLSHELRTPLTLISAPLEQIMKSKDMNPEILGKLAMIHNQTEKMAKILNLTLKMNSLENGGLVVQVDDVEFNSWVSECVDAFRMTLSSMKLSVETVLDPSIGIVWMDISKCDIILSNLLMNACKYSRPLTTVKVETRMNADSTVSVLVYNSGDGFHGTDPDRLFEKFFKLNEESSGFGLGLAYCKLLAELQNGSIGADDSGKDTLFWFTIPSGEPLPKQKDRNPEKRVHSADMDECGVSAAFDLHGFSVLIVDDQRELIEMLKEYLSPEFANVYVAGDGEEAMRSMEEHCPDLIVSDVMMPRMDGYNLCREIKTDIRYSHIPIILLTARADEESRMIGYKVGADAYLAKPFGVDSLLVVIRNMMKTRNDLRVRMFSDPTKTVVDCKADTFSVADERLIRKLNDYIDTHISNPDISVDDIARHLALSRTLLYNKFRTITGQGVMSYINRVRMGKAAEWLESTDRPISEIAMAVGFTDNAYFSTAFKKVYGKTPSKYRSDRLAGRDNMG